MARFTFGGTIYDLVASPNDELEITSPLALVPNAEVPFYLAPGGTEATDFLVWDSIDDDFTDAQTVITTDAEGFLPAFQGPDGVEVLYDASGRALLARDASAEGSGVPAGGTTGQALVKQSDDDGDADWEALPTWSTISGKPTVVAAGSDAAAARTAIGAAAAADIPADFDTRYYTKTQVDDLLAAAGIGGDYPAARNVYETAGSLPTREATGIPETTPINVILELGSTKDPFSVTYGYVPGFDRVGKTVLA